MSTIKSIKSYGKKKSNTTTQSVEVFNNLFAKNMSKRLIAKTRKKINVKIKELPPRTETCLYESSLDVSVNDTFDKLRKGGIQNEIKMEENLAKLNSTETDVSQLSSIKINVHSPVMTRKRKRKVVPKIIEIESDLSDKLKKSNTLDKSISNSLYIEEKNCNQKTNLSSLSYIKFPYVNKTSNLLQVTDNCINRMEASYEPVFSDTFRERQNQALICSSTPIVSATTNKLLLDPISPIQLQLNVSNFLEESYNEINKWNDTFPSSRPSGEINDCNKQSSKLENSLSKSNNSCKKINLKVNTIFTDRKLKIHPKVHLRKLDIQNGFKGFDSSKLNQSSSQSFEIIKNFEKVINYNSSLSNEFSSKISDKIVGSNLNKSESLLNSNNFNNKNSQFEDDKISAVKRIHVNKSKSQLVFDLLDSSNENSKHTCVTKRKIKNLDQQKLELTIDSNNSNNQDLNFSPITKRRTNNFDRDNLRFSSVSNRKTKTVDQNELKLLGDANNSDTRNCPLEENKNSTERKTSNLIYNSTITLNKSEKFIEQNKSFKNNCDNKFEHSNDLKQINNSCINLDSIEELENNNKNKTESVNDINNLEIKNNSEQDLNDIVDGKVVTFMLDDSKDLFDNSYSSTNNSKEVTKNITSEHSYSLSLIQENEETNVDSDVYIIEDSSSDEVEIIETSQILNKDEVTAVTHNFIKPKLLSLKPGKSYRRSLSILRRSCIITNDENIKFVCSSSPLIRNLQSFNRLDRRTSIKILPDNTILPKKSSNCYESSQENIIDAQFDHSLKSFSLNCNNSLQVTVSAQDIVLRRCGQTEPLPFEECYTPSVLQNCQKIGEGVYGEVFLFQNPNVGTSVMKIIPIEGDQIVNGEKQKKFKEILSEVIISMELSNLRNIGKNSTNGFVEVFKIQCVRGTYPERLIDLWDLYNDNHGSENDSPEMFRSNQLYIVLELANCGKDLECYMFNNASQAFSMLKQTACALAVAESQLQFEHRDLHWGNILINTVNKNKKLQYHLNGKEITIVTHGVQISIIDFTLSRIVFEDVVIFNDLSLDQDLFNAKGDYQFEIYKLMQKRNGNEWKHYEPFTNILWMHYLADKAFTALNYKNLQSKVHKDNMVKIKQIKNEILSYNSVTDFVTDKYF